MGTIVGCPTIRSAAHWFFFLSHQLGDHPIRTRGTVGSPNRRLSYPTHDGYLSELVVDRFGLVVFSPVQHQQIFFARHLSKPTCSGISRRLESASPTQPIHWV